MNAIHVEATAIIDARPQDVYAVVADYREAHRAIMPRPYFVEMNIEKGGIGAGTEYRLRMNIFGKDYHYHHRVTEPEPGRVMVETDIETGQFSKFVIDPVNGGKQSRVTIVAEYPASPGFVGFMERLMNPPVSRRIFNKELQNLNTYLRAQNTVVAGS
jgi:hypothetical protein